MVFYEYLTIYFAFSHGYNEACLGPSILLFFLQNNVRKKLIILIAIISAVRIS